MTLKRVSDLLVLGSNPSLQRDFFEFSLFGKTDGFLSVRILRNVRVDSRTTKRQLQLLSERCECTYIFVTKSPFCPLTHTRTYTLSHTRTYTLSHTRTCLVSIFPPEKDHFCIFWLHWLDREEEERDREMQPRKMDDIIIQPDIETFFEVPFHAPRPISFGCNFYFSRIDTISKRRLIRPKS